MNYLIKVMPFEIEKCSMLKTGVTTEYMLYIHVNHFGQSIAFKYIDNHAGL